MDNRDAIQFLMDHDIEFREQTTHIDIKQFNLVVAMWWPIGNMMHIVASEEKLFHHDTILTYLAGLSVPVGIVVKSSKMGSFNLPSKDELQTHVNEFNRKFVEDFEKEHSQLLEALSRAMIDKAQCGVDMMDIVFTDNVIQQKFVKYFLLSGVHYGYISRVSKNLEEAQKQGSFYVIADIIGLPIFNCGLYIYWNNPVGTREDEFFEALNDIVKDMVDEQ